MFRHPKRLETEAFHFAGHRPRSYSRLIKKKQDSDFHARTSRQNDTRRYRFLIHATSFRKKPGLFPLQRIASDGSERARGHYVVIEVSRSTNEKGRAIVIKRSCARL